MNNDVLVDAQGLTRRYGLIRAVSGLDLQLRNGEILGLLGPNGAGKSTTLRMLAGCLAPSEGRVIIHGHDMARCPSRAKRHLGYLPERPPLYPEQTVREYLAFCARLHRIPRREQTAAVASAMTDCGLSDMGGRLIGHCSKGYQQRVGIAQAILHRPDVVILDEPTAGLDPNQIREIRALIRRLGESHSVILSSHILPEIQATCARVAIIHGGQLVFDRPMHEVDGDDHVRTLRLGLRRPPGSDIIAAVPGVERVQVTDDDLWQLTCAPGADPREALARQAARDDWGLFELSQPRRTLEDIFTELTSADRAAPRQAA